VVESIAAEMKTAYSYVRFSTPQQALGDSLRRQVAAAEQFCKENGYTLDRSLTLHDKGIRAFRGENIEIGRLGVFLGLVKAGTVKRGSALCVENLDRLSRAEITDALGVFLDLIRSGITVITLTDKRIYNRESINRNPGELMASIVFLMRANDESKVKSVRVKEAYDQRKKAAKENDFKSLAWCPPWCDFDKEQGYTINKGRAAIVRRIYDEYLRGNGPFRISRMFNAEKIPTLGHRGFRQYKNTTQQWYKKTIRDFLFDRRVYGYCEFLDKENYFPAIIPKDKYNAVQNRLALRAQAEPTGGPTEGQGNLFTGICRCSVCGSLMTKSSTRKHYKNKVTLYEYLVCDGARSGKKCSYRSVSYREFEREWLQAIRTDAYFKAMTKYNPQKEIEERLASMQGEIVTNDRQIEKLTRMILKDENPSVTLVNQLKQFEARQVQLSKDIQLATAQLKTVQSVPTLTEAVRKEADEMLKTKEGRMRVREFLRSTVDRIVVDAAHGVSQIYFKSGFVGTMNVLVGEEEEGEDGIVRVKLTGPVNFTIRGP